MPRFVVTAEFNTAQADKDLRAFKDRIRASTDTSGAAAGGNGAADKALERQAKGVRGVSKEYEDLRNRISQAKADMATVGKEINSTAGIRKIVTDLENVRKEAVLAREKVRSIDSDGFDPKKAREYAVIIQQATAALEKFSAAQRGGRTTEFVDKSYIQNIKTLDSVMSQLENNRKNGIGSLEKYRQELLAIQSASSKRANDTGLSQAERGLYANRAGKAGNLINAADAAEAKKLENAIVRVNDLLTREKLTAEQASKALTALAERSGQLASAQNVSNAAATRYLQTQEKLRAAASKAAGGDSELIAAQRTSEAIRQATAQRKAGITSIEAYKARLTELARTSQVEAQNTLRSAAAIKEYTAAAGQARVALERLKREQAGQGSAGNTPFALNTVAFGFGAVGAGATSFLTEALDLNEKAKMSALNLSATAKYYNFSGQELAKSVEKVSKDIRVSATDVSQATTYLIKAGFDPEAAAVSIKRFSDSGVANALNASKAIAAAAQGVQQGRSVLLNTAGIEENIGPEIQAIERAIKKGQEYTRNVYLMDDAARALFDRQIKGGVAFREAADAAGRFQFLLKATRVDAGRTAETTDSLTAALGNFTTQSQKAKISLLEGVSRIASPILNSASAFLAGFDALPATVKNTVGLTVALGTLAAITIASGAGLLALGLQTRKVLADEGALTVVRGLLAKSTARLTIANTILTAQLGSQAYANATVAASTAVATGATNTWAASLARLGVAFNFLKANPVLAALTVTTGALLYANEYAKNTLKIYDDIEASDKAFHDQLVAQNGEEFVAKLAQLQTYLEARGQLESRLASAKTPQEKEDIAGQISRVNALIDLRRKELAEIKRVNAEQKGAAGATLEQAEAYRVLKEQLDAVAERYGDMKLTTFQKDLRSLQQEQARQVAAIDKGSREYVSSERQSGINPEQEAKLRAQAAQLVPKGIAGLVAREVEEARKAALTARQAMEREQLDLAKDGVAKRQAVLKLDTQGVKDEYAEQEKVVLANKRALVAKLGDQGLSQAEGVNITNQINELVGVELSLIATRDARIKALEQKATADLINLRRERKRALEDITRSQVDAEIRQLGLVQQQINNGRDAALARSTDDGGRLAVEQAFAARSVELTRRTAQLQAQEQRAAAKRTYDDAILQAETLGDKRAQAERIARQNLASELKSIELDSANTVTDVRIQAEGRVQAARATVIQSGLDKELEAVSEIEGAQLAALQRRYTRELQLARGRGDAPAASAYEGALKTISGEATSRAKAARDLVKQAGDEVDGLNTKLAELTGRAAKGLEGARVAASKPFEDFIQARIDEGKKLNEARAKLVGRDPALVKSIDDRVRELNTYIAQARAEQVRAVNQAELGFNQAARDKAVKAAADTAAKLYNGGEGDAAAYRAALNTEQLYWQTRLKGLEEGSAEYETATGRIEELAQTRREVRLREAAAPLEQLRNRVTSNEGQAALARTEDERNTLLGERINLLRQVITLETARANNPELSRADRQTAGQNAQQAATQLQAAQATQGGAAAADLRVMLAQLDAQRELVKGDAARLDIDNERLVAARQIADADQRASQQGGLTLEQRRAAEQQSLTSRKAVLDIERQIQATFNEATRSLRDLTAAQLDYTATAATSDAGVTQAMEDRLGLVRDQLADQDELIRQAVRRGDSESVINGLKAQRIKLAQQELSEERAISARPVEIATRQLSVYQQIAKARLDGSSAAGDEVSAAAQQLDFAERELHLAQDRLEVAVTQADVEKAGADIATAFANLGRAQAGVNTAPIVQGERLLALDKARSQAALILSGLGQDEFAASQQALNVADAELLLAEQRVAAAGTQVELDAANTTLAEKQVAQYQARLAVTTASIAQQQRELGIRQALSKEALTLAGLGDDEVLRAQQSAEAASAEVQFAEQRVNASQTQIDRENALGQLAQARTAEYEAQQALITAELGNQDRLLGLLQRQATASAQVSGASKDPANGKRLDLEFTRTQAAENARRLANADALLLSEQQRQELQVKGLELSAQERGQEEELTRILFDQARLRADIDEAAIRSQLGRSRFFNDAVTLSRLELAATQARLAQNATEINQAGLLGYAVGDLLGLQKQRVELLGQETAQTRTLAEAERGRTVFLRSLRDSLEDLRSAAGSQLEGAGTTRAVNDVALSYAKLREAEGDAGGFLSKLSASQAALSALQKLAGVNNNARLAVELGFVAAGDDAATATEKVAQLTDASRRFLGLQPTRQASGLGALLDDLKGLETVSLDQLAASIAKVRASGQEISAGYAAELYARVGALTRSRQEEEAQVGKGRRNTVTFAALLTEMNQVKAEISDSDALDRAINDQFLSFNEAEEGKQRVEALTAALGVYRAKLGALADSYDAQVTGIEAVADATLRLNDLVSSAPQSGQPASSFAGADSQSQSAQAFIAAVNETKRQQALGETDRLLHDQRTTYAQLSAAAGRLAEAEQGGLALERARLSALGERARREGQSSGAAEELRQRIASLGYSGQETTAILHRVSREGASALGDLDVRISDAAQERLEQLRARTLSSLTDVGRLRAEAFKTRLESAREFEEYATLNSAVRLASAGFSELEASQLDAATRQEQLKALIGQSSFLAPEQGGRGQAAQLLDQENRALVRQVQLRKDITDARAVTRDDLAQQRQLNAAAAQYADIQEGRLRALSGQAKGAAYNADSAELKSALLLDQAIEDARYSDARRARAVQFEVEKALAVDRALAPLSARLSAERAASEAKSAQNLLSGVTLPDLSIQAAPIGGRTGARLAEGIQGKLDAWALPNLEGQGRTLGQSVGQAILKAMQSVLSQPVTLDVQGRLSGVAAGTAGARLGNTTNVTNNWSAPVTVYAAEGQDAESIANVVIDRLERQSDLLGGNC